MKLLDEKGRILGKLNILDLLIVLLAAAAVWLAAPRLFRTAAAEDGGSVRMTYTVRAEELTPKAYASLAERIPSRLMSAGSLLDGRVVSAEAEPCVVYTENPQGELVPADETLLLNVLFTVEVMVPKQGVMLNTVGNQEVRIGKDHLLRTEYFELYGTVLTAEWEE